MSIQRFLGAASISLILSACGQSAHVNNDNAGNANIRPPTSDEKAADFDQLAQLFKDFYGPYQLKEKNFAINIEQSLEELKAKALNAKTDEEFIGYIMSFGAILRDGHVQISAENSASNIVRYKIPILLTPLEGKAIIGDIDAKLTESINIKAGDEVLAIDGQSPFDLLSVALKYRRVATTASDQSFLLLYALQRPSYMTDLIPTKPMADVKFKKADGTTVIYSIPWIVEKYSPGLENTFRSKTGKEALNLTVPFANDYNAAVDSHRGQMGKVTPIFVTNNVLSTYDFVKVYPSDAARKKFGLSDIAKPPIYAAIYRFDGKTILLVRQATYSPSDYSPSTYMKAYKALLSEYEKLADVLVLDQTHNPGGSYCADFYNIFGREGDVQAVQKVRADRKWINDLYVNWQEKPDSSGTDDINPWDNRVLNAWGSMVEKAYDAGDFMSEPFPLFANSNYVIPQDYTWKKPMLVLIDELAGSCGDMFPMLVKANKRAKLFGQTTMGLGGNVEEVGVLNNSRLHVSLTRGSFFAFRADGAYVPSDLVENNGVAPDITYAHTVADFRSGYVNYVKTFSQAAVEQIPAATAVEIKK